MSRILSMNETYIKSLDEKILFEKFLSFTKNFKDEINDSKKKIIFKSLNFLKNKAKTLQDVYNNSIYILKDDLLINNEDKLLIDEKSKQIILSFIKDYQQLNELDRTSLEIIIKKLIDKFQTNFKGVGQPLRIGLVGTKFGPGIYDIILSLDKSTVIKRLEKIV